MTNLLTAAPEPVAPPGGPGRRYERLLLFVRGRNIAQVVFGASLGTMLAAGVWREESLWLGAGIWLTLFLVGHALFASRTVPWIPGLIALVACLQWIISPWASYHVPPVFPLFAMVLQPDAYFAFAVPAVFALTIGLFLPLRRQGRVSQRHLEKGTVAHTALVKILRTMVLGGIFVRLVLMPFAPSGGRFLMLLVANLAFVGMFGSILLRARHWPLYAVLVIGMQAIFSSADGMFHDLLLWVTYLVAILAFTYRLRMRVLLAAGVAGFFLVFTLNAIKQEFRLVLESRNPTVSQRALLLGELLADRVMRPDEVFNEEKLAYNISRTNQGWLIARTLNYVPDAEPFAEGETVTHAVRAAILPRFFDPLKYQAGSTEYVSRFTGLRINRQTSMGLSLAGEMYANFGRGGALLGLVAVGYALGLLFRVFLRWSRSSVLWWAWAPYVMLYTMQAESGLAEALNHVVKSSVVMFATIAFVPAWASLRRWGRASVATRAAPR